MMNYICQVITDNLLCGCLSKKYPITTPSPKITLISSYVRPATAF
jgi:hypothetical protein